MYEVELKWYIMCYFEKNVIICILWLIYVFMGGFNGRILVLVLRFVSMFYEKDIYIFDFIFFWIILWLVLVVFKSGIKIICEKKLDWVINEIF